VPEYPLGSRVASGRIRCWRDIAEDTFGFLESLLLDPSRSRWIARERAVRQLLAYRTGQNRQGSTFRQNRHKTDDDLDSE